MTVKTLTGPSIQDALAKARSELGDDVVLMESTPATADAPAQIAVMIDPSAPDPASSRTSRGRVPKPPGDGPLPVPDADPDGAGPHTSDPGTSDPDTRTPGAGASGYGYGGADEGGVSPNDGPPVDDPDDGRDFRRVLEQKQETGRGRIFPVSDDPDDASDRGDATRPASAEQSSFPERTGGHSSADTAGHGQWSAHPLYDVLLDKGLRPDTVTRLFDDLSDRGIDLANNPSEDLRWAFAQLLCRRIDVADSDRVPAPLALIGPGGAGKTSLLLKLAMHDHLLTENEPIVLHLPPEEDHGTAYQNPTPLYQRHGLPIQNVRTEDEMAKALNRARGFGRVLIDTPPLPLPLDEARPALRRIEHLLRPLRSLRVHFVLSATHAFDSLDPEALPHLPLRPDATSITHLDEAANWGRMIEWLLALDLPVRFVSEGPQVPDGVRAFSLKWFVDDLMDL